MAAALSGELSIEVINSGNDHSLDMKMLM